MTKTNPYDPPIVITIEPRNNPDPHRWWRHIACSFSSGAAGMSIAAVCGQLFIWPMALLQHTIASITGFAVGVAFYIIVLRPIGNQAAADRAAMQPPNQASTSPPYPHDEIKGD